jgi:hypothetical protein
VKLTGKLGDNDIAVLSALDAASSTPNGGSPLVNIVRLQRDIAPQSTAGLLYADRVGGGRDNTVGGGDVHLTFDKLYYAQFQAVMSSTTAGGRTSAGPMWEAVVDRTGRAFGFHYNILGVHPDFVTDNGFVSRTGVIQPGIANRYTWYGAPGGLLERFNMFVRTLGTWRYDDFLASRHVLEENASANMQFTVRGGWNVNLTPSVGSYAFDSAAYGGVRTIAAGGAVVPFVPAGRKQNTLVNFSIATPQYPGFAASVGTTFGNDIDFFETSAVRRADYNASLDLRPSDRLRVSATYVSTRFTRTSDGTQVVSMRIPRLLVEYQLARPLFVRVVSQYTANVQQPLVDPVTGATLLVSDGIGGFTPSTVQAANTLRADFLISYRPNPGTVVFAGYGNSLTESDPLAFRQLRRTTDGYFVKLSYLFRAVRGAD